MSRNSQNPRINARRLRQALARLDWPQEQLAKELGVSGASVSNWASGRKGISELNLKRMADALRIEDSMWLVDDAIGEDLPDKQVVRRYGPGAYGTGQRAAFMRALTDELREIDVKLLPHVDVSVRYPRFIPLPMDYCSGSLALVAVPLLPGRVRPAELHDAMVRLITLEKLDKDVSVGRHHVLAAVAENGLFEEEEQALNLQCQLFGVEFSVFSDVVKVAEFIGKFEKE